MRKLIFSIVLLLIVTSCKKAETESAPEDNPYARYAVRSGIVKYKTTLKGEMMGSKVNGSGTSTLYFKDWGALELREDQLDQSTEVDILGKKQKTEEHNRGITKMDKGDLYVVDFENKKIRKMKNMGEEMLKGMDYESFGKEMLKKMGAKQLGNEKFKGYDCEVWDLNGAKQYYYKGIPLRSEMKIMGISTVTEATEAEFNVSVPDSKFKLPDYEVVETEMPLNGEGMKELMQDEDFQKDVKEAQKNLEKMSDMSFEEWKEFVGKQDPEMKNMTDEELRQSYDMIQKMSEFTGSVNK